MELPHPDLPPVSASPKCEDAKDERKETVGGGLNSKAAEFAPSSPGTARINAFYPTAGYTMLPTAPSPTHNGRKLLVATLTSRIYAEFGAFFAPGMMAPHQFVNLAAGQTNGYPYGTLYPSYSYDASMALAALAISEAQARIHSSSNFPHYATDPSTPQGINRETDLTEDEHRELDGHSWQRKHNIGKSRSDAASWRKTMSSSLLRSASVPYRGGPLSFLDKFKNVAGEGYTLEKIRGQVASFALDQTGSRWLQSQLDEQGAVGGNLIIDEILQNALLLSRDIFGNYVVQKIFRHADSTNKDALGHALKGRMRRLTFHVYGCRVVQQAVEHISTEVAAELVRELEEVVRPCVLDTNGNHVIQKCIEFIPTEHISFLIAPLLGHVKEIGRNQYGCRVIQRIIEHCAVGEVHDEILEEIIESISELASTEYGNYVVQHVAEHGGATYRKKATHRIGTNFRLLSHQKFASRVVEKFLEVVDEDERRYIIESMFPMNNGQFTEEEWILDMILDPYANYILQKIFEVSSEEMNARFAPLLITHRRRLLEDSYGKSVIDAAINEGIIRATDLTLAMLSDASSTITE